MVSLHSTIIYPVKRINLASAKSFRIAFQRISPIKQYTITHVICNICLYYYEHQITEKRLNKHGFKIEPCGTLFETVTCVMLQSTFDILLVCKLSVPLSSNLCKSRIVIVFVEYLLVFLCLCVLSWHL